MNQILLPFHLSWNRQTVDRSWRHCDCNVTELIALYSVKFVACSNKARCKPKVETRSTNKQNITFTETDKVRTECSDLCDSFTFDSRRFSLPCARPPSSERKAWFQPVPAALRCQDTVQYHQLGYYYNSIWQEADRSCSCACSSSSCSPGATKRMSRDSLGREFGFT